MHERKKNTHIVALELHTVLLAFPSTNYTQQSNGYSVLQERIVRFKYVNCGECVYVCECAAYPQSNVYIVITLKLV